MPTSAAARIQLPGSARLMVAGDALDAASSARTELAAGDNAALQTLAMVALQAGETGAAIAYLEEAITKPEARPSWFHNLASVYGSAGMWDRMIEAAGKGLRVHPNDSALILDAARAEVETGAYKQAVDRYETLAERGPIGRHGLFHWAQALSAIDTTAAVHKLDECIEAFPAFAPAHEMMAEILSEHGYITHAASSLETVHRLQPDNARMTAKLAFARWRLGDMDGAMALAQDLISDGTAGSAVHSFYLTSLLHRSTSGAEPIRLAHEAWADRFAATARQRHFDRKRDPDKRLRVGYLGGDYTHNPSYYFLIHLFRHRNPADFEIFVYDLAGSCDHASLEVEDLADHWRRMAKMSDQDLIATIRQDEIDILVDTCGHYDKGRPWVFAERIAPVQTRIPNYPSTTGMSHFDAIISDDWVCPEGTEEQYTEKVLRASGGYMAYTPPANAPDVGPPPSLKNGYLTFGLFQRIQKITQACWNEYAKVLARFPGSRLLVHTGSSDLELAGSPLSDVYRMELSRRGIDPSCIDFYGPAPIQHHLRILALCDIALDTFPYNGQTTTCECLWMGVPVVSLLGEYHVSRVGHWVLDRAGYGEWCAKDRVGFQDVIGSLASDLEALAALRMSMRGRVAASLLTDGARITADTERCYRQLWKEWCNT